MSQHARIEEVSDSDLESDPSEQDLEDFAPISLARSSAPTVPTPSQQEFAQIHAAAAAAAQHAASSPANELKVKKYQCLYPLYFDSNRSRAQGRRVGKEFAVRNPLAREIVDAVQLLGLDTVFEPGKTHPKDWSNPGRVRVLVKENGSLRNRVVRNSRFYRPLFPPFLSSFGFTAHHLPTCPFTPFPIPSISVLSHGPLPPSISKPHSRRPIEHHLYILVSKHLLANPINSESPLRLRIQGMSPPELPLPTPDIPRGWKMNTVLPLHSPALSGGGVSDNIIKDMMQEFQAGQAGGLQGMAGQRGGGLGKIEGDAQGKRKREREGGKRR